MLIISIILFLCAAVFGLVLLTRVLKDQPTPGVVILAHGGFAIAAVLVLITYIVTGHMDTLVITSLVLFILAALGGLTLLTFDLSKKPIPKLIAVIHPLIAVSALIILIIFALRVTGVLTT